jgi:hypothetical protein
MRPHLVAADDQSAAIRFHLYCKCCCTIWNFGSEFPLARRTNQPETAQPDLPPEKAYAALTKQLDLLPKLNGRDCRDAGADEDEWTNLTEKLIIRAFGSDSANLKHLSHAKSAGQIASMTGPRPTLITTAVGFITANSASLIMCRVFSVNGAVATM